MRCEEIMKRDVVRINEGEPVRAGAELMRAGNFGFLPVVDKQDRVVGTITDRDLAVRVVADALSPSTPTGEVMTREVVACKPEDDVTTARQIMATYHKSRLIVQDTNGTLQGVISLSDLAEQLPTEQSGETLRKVAERE